MSLPILRLSFLRLPRMMIASGTVLLGLATFMGCAQTVKNLAGTAGAAAASAAPPALLNGLDQMNEPENQVKLQTLARSPAVQQTTHDVGAGLGRGMVDEVVAIASGSDQWPATTQRTTKLAGPSGAQVADFVRVNIGPALAQLIQSAIKAAGPAIAQSIREQIAPAVADTIRQQVGDVHALQIQQVVTQFIHELINREIVPAIHQLLVQTAGDAFLVPVRPEVSPAVVQNARNLSLGASRGSHDGMVEMGLLSPAGDLTGTAKNFVWAIAAMIVLVGLAAVALLIVLMLIALALWRRPPIGRSKKALG